MHSCLTMPSNNRRRVSRRKDRSETMAAIWKGKFVQTKKTKETKLINKEISWTTRTNHVKSTHSKELPQSPWRNCGGCFSPGKLGKFAHQMQKNCLNITNWQDENFVHPRKWHTKKNIWNVESNAWFVSDQKTDDPTNWFCGDHTIVCSHKQIKRQNLNPGTSTYQYFFPDNTP